MGVHLGGQNVKMVVLGFQTINLPTANIQELEYN